MTHELGSKMASKHACIILHIRVSAYAVLLNIPRLWLCCWGGAGKGQRSSSPEGPEFVLSSLPWWPYPAFQVLWSTSSICAACSSPQVCAGLVGLENVSGFSVLYWIFYFGFFLSYGVFWSSSPMKGIAIARRQGLYEYILSVFQELAGQGRSEGEPSFGKSHTWTFRNESMSTFGWWHCFFWFLPIWQSVLPPLLMESVNN